MRVVCVVQSWDFVGQMYTDPHEGFRTGRWAVTTNFPPDARLLSVVSDDQRRVLRFYYEHASFTEVPESATVPEVAPMFTVHDLQAGPWRSTG